MSIERRDPVPIGRYYAFIEAERVPEWNAWLKRHSSAVSVVAIEAQTVSPRSVIWGMTPGLEAIKTYAGDWVLFDVKAPVPWVNIGLPTIVTDARVRSTADVYQFPAPDPDAADQVASLLKGLLELSVAGAVVVLGSAVLEGIRATRRIGGRL